jgi:hypothetical protein
MQGSNSGQDDAFARALKEAFGDQASPERIAQARENYARHRTDDMLKRLSGAVGKNDNRDNNTNDSDESLPGTGDQPR